MNIGHVFILGQIGHSYNEQGEISEEGVDLLSVVEQVEALGEVDAVHVHIDSPGGYVNIGNSIADLIGSIPNCFTIAENLCASIATKIHLAVPLQNRMVEEGCNYVIHNPFLSEVTGDASQLQDYANSVKETEKELEKMYSSATGLKKETISGLMAIETAITADQCVKLNFASKIVQKQQARIVARIYNKNDMSKAPSFKERIKSAVASLKGENNPETEAEKAAAEKAKIDAGREAKALFIDTADGTIETPFVDLMVGDPALVGGETAPDGTYEVVDGEVLLVDGTVIGKGSTVVVSDGVISSITPNEVEAENSVEALEAKLKAAEEANASLTSQLEESNTEKTEALEEIEELAKLKSNYTPPKVQANFKKRPEAPLTTKEKMDARKALYKQNKA